MRYYDELPRSAQVAFRNAIGAARDDRPEARDAFACLGFTGLQLLPHFRIFADRVLYALHCLEGDGPGVIGRILFGTEHVDVILALASDVFEETEYRWKGLEDRIRARMAAGTSTPADIAWLREQAFRFCDELVLEADVLGRDGGREVSREIVRGAPQRPGEVLVEQRRQQQPRIRAGVPHDHLTAAQPLAAIDGDLRRS